jgi:N-acetylmuramic acid 6-phosphate etherase
VFGEKKRVRRPLDPGPSLASIPLMQTVPATEVIDPRTEQLDSWPPEAILATLWEGQMAAVAATRPALPAIAAAANAAAVLLATGGRLVYAGAGTSGRIGVQDGAELPPTFDWPQDRLVLLMAGGEQAFTHSVENAEDDTEAAVAAIARHGIGAGDVVLGIAASGSTPFTTAALSAAAARGALTIGIANSPGGGLLAACSHRILAETGPEAIAGSTRMKAGTAQKVVLNLFSTLLMVQLGRVHRGLMVDMLARNDKLRRRAERMLAHLTGAPPEAIRAALGEAGGSVKRAVLVLQGLSAADAQALLDANANNLRLALAQLHATRETRP